MFGKRITELRKAKNLTQLELANLIGTSRSAISLYEIEKREPDIATLNNLASLFNVSVDYILGNDSDNLTNTNYTADNSEFLLTFKIRIQELLTEYNMTKKNLEKLMNPLNNEKIDFLYNEQVPSIGDLIKISKILNVSIDYLLGISSRKCITTEEELLLQAFNLCNNECKKYLLAKADVLCVEGINAVASDEYGKYSDSEKKLFPSNGTKGKGA